MPVIGRDAARAAAEAHISKKRPLATPYDTVAPLTRAEKRAKRQAGRREAKRLQESEETGTLSSAPPPTSGGKGPGGGDGGAGGGGGKGLSPLKPPDVKKGSIVATCVKDGTGAVEVHDRLLVGGDVPRADWGCGWLETTGVCRKASTGDCPRCKTGNR